MKPHTISLLRPAVAADVPACVVLRGQTRENAVSPAQLQARGITASSWADDTRRGVLVGHVAVGATPNTAGGAENHAEGHLMGYAFGAPATGEVVVLALRPEAEGQGLGRALLARVVADLRAVGHSRLFLSASANPAHRSHGFYRHLGWHLGWQSGGGLDAFGDELLVLPAAVYVDAHAGAHAHPHAHPHAPAQDPLLLNLPAQIDTPRLLLRVPCAGDGAALHAAVAESLPELRRYLGFLPWLALEPTLALFEARCRSGAAHFIARTDLPFLCFEKTSGLLVGSVGLHRTVWATPKTEVGYWVRTSCAGQGLVSEAVAALTSYAFEHVRAVRVELVTDADNTASRRVAERCGFVLEAHRRSEHRAADGALRDTCVYARWPLT